jgi:hypothetical protein
LESRDADVCASLEHPIKLIRLGRADHRHDQQSGLPLLQLPDRRCSVCLRTREEYGVGPKNVDSAERLAPALEHRRDLDIRMRLQERAELRRVANDDQPQNPIQVHLPT